MTEEILEAPQYLESIEDRDERSLLRMHAFVEALSTDYQRGRLSQEKISKIYRSFGEEFLNNTLQGYGWRKPFGYAGDFLMIDKIYTRYTSDNPKFRLWDEYFHRQAAPRAVRNRKEYFKQLIHRKLQTEESLTLLDMASGPARDLAEVYESIDQPSRLQTTCVDMDARAITYARKLNQRFLSHIEFVHKNVLRFHCQQKFHLIWSAGLFDYFNDNVFVAVLRRFRNFLEPGGEIVIGNFNQDNNPSRAYMEIFGDWFLYHRTEQQLIELAQKAGFYANEIYVGHEPENVNLFLHIKSDDSKNCKSKNI